MPGENGPTLTGVGLEATPSRVTITFTVAEVPLGTMSQGICALICDVICCDGSSGCTKSIGALILFEPFTKVTLVPPREAESGMVDAAATLLASELPKIEIKEPGVI